MVIDFVLFSLVLLEDLNLIVFNKMRKKQTEMEILELLSSSGN